MVRRMIVPPAEQIVLPSSRRAREALGLASELQRAIADRMEHVSLEVGLGDVGLERVWWGRDEGQHGGGNRLQRRDVPAFNRLSINVSGVHYDDMPSKRLSSASALSTIIHPNPARAPSMHMHISYTEMRNGNGYWRMMADLNPSNPFDDDTRVYKEAVRSAFVASGVDSAFESATAQGDKYFYIPALKRHRGTFHSYLEQYDSGNFESDSSLARHFGNAALTAYADILTQRLKEEGSEAEKQAQLAYHTLYFFQVLTLDRGTTSGLLVHNQNDVGILGSLPSHVDVGLLRSWQRQAPEVKQALVEALLAVFPSGGRAEVTEERKRRLASAVREFYRENPEALALQASGNVVPPTVQNHS